ncbi:hypothetical protein [Herbaspirillum sp. RV1423]|uniref:hypothetical protein n=1 Tax=Herbaspirillum sp. RV1423 TaxID=1443993 RepID=UPI001E3504D1|nr:hypothetical protein [Herbaspirillum sp. RV1423]
MQVSKGKLTDAERDALQKLAGGFQDAIDGLAAVPPRLNLGGLTQFDPALLSSVDLHASVPAGGSDKQTIDFHADSKQRTVSANGPSGAMKVSVDTSNSAILGSAAQQKQAIDRYLKQFDAAQNRGHGGASLMGMFKDAFREMNSNIGTQQQQQQQRAQNPSAIWLNKTDQSMLTGLADFSASVTQNADWSNPMRRDESDTFSYQTSQNSSVKGSGQLNRSITQDQQSHLSASYHESLLADVPLKLSTDRQSQNYYYRQIKDDASSHASIAYDKGALVSASLKQTASQSTRVRKYVMGNLEEDTTTPSQATLSRDFLDLLKPLQKKETSHAPDDMNTLQQALSTINNLVYLQADPAQLRSEGLT